MLELAITPSILRGKRQAPPGATLKAPAELMPQVDSVPAIGHSEAARAADTDAKPGTARTMAKANAFDTRMKSPSISFRPLADAVFSGRQLDLDQRSFGPGLGHLGRPAGCPFHRAQ